MQASVGRPGQPDMESPAVCHSESERQTVQQGLQPHGCSEYVEKSLTVRDT